LADAQSGYRFFRFGEIADLLSRARKIWEANQDLEFHETRLDRDYATLIPDDTSLFERFEEAHKALPSEFADL